MASTKSTRVPKEWEARYAILTEMTDIFCQSHLNDEYAALARSAIAALCRKRPSPLASGNPQTWACTVVLALGQVNFLADRASSPYMALSDLCAHFGVAYSTAGGRAKLVRNMLGMHQFSSQWTLPSRLADSPLVLLSNGFVIGIRRPPLDSQPAADADTLRQAVPAAESS